MFGLLVLASSDSILSGDTPANAPVGFNRDVRAILTKNCFACHGLDPDARQADLRLDVRSAAIDGGAIIPHRPDKSELIARVRSQDPDRLMPPPDSGHTLSKDELATLDRWIAGGAVYEDHWSFTVPIKRERPQVENRDWPRTPIDHFVLQKLEAAGLSPSAPADRAILLRRVSIDLTGLPPTPEQTRLFLSDDSQEAFEKVVDRLLGSKAYGEHWARMWLDLARYADTKGYEKDRHRDIWRFRDWVIDAFNRDMPYDQFTLEQLAGDLLPNATDSQILATAFHRNTMTNDEGGTDNEEFRVAAVKDRVDTTIQVWMGLTMGCAKCHSHKYDPISLSDYYAFYACFNQTRDADNEVPLHPTPTTEQAKQLEALQHKIDSLEKASTENPDGSEEQRAEALAKAQQERKRLLDAVPKTPVMFELAPKKRRTTRIHSRGNFLDPGDEVSAKVLSRFGQWRRVPRAARNNKDDNDGVEPNRADVARWLMQPENPLTSRVMVNRIWARLFGIGLVETEEDFGTQGTSPSHPELLDWMAVDFREQGWSIKRLLKSIVMSRTYRQDASLTPEKLSADPNNRLLSRGPRFRLSAEMVRDQALAASGLLTEKVGGPSVMPPQPSGIWKTTYSGETWKNATGEDRYRRGLYTYLKRTSPYPAMITFDAGSGEVCQLRRVRTNTPLQALVTLNDTVFVEAAGALALKMHQSGDDLREQITNGFSRVLVRQPDTKELETLVTLYHSLENQLSDSQTLTESAGLSRAANGKRVDARLIAIANVLLNLDETLTKP